MSLESLFARIGAPRSIRDRLFNRGRSPAFSNESSTVGFARKIIHPLVDLSARIEKSDAPFKPVDEAKTDFSDGIVGQTGDDLWNAVFQGQIARNDEVSASLIDGDNNIIPGRLLIYAGVERVVSKNGEERRIVFYSSEADRQARIPIETAKIKNWTKLRHHPGNPN